MELYKHSDIQLLESHVDKILEEIENKKNQLFGPTKDEISQVTNIILQFIIEKKRKIYGGYALNLLITDKNPDDAIYTAKDNPDIDFYSPEPIKDLIDICNKLHEKEFQYVMGKEALHKETYSIYVNLQLYCDISYVPKNIYNKMPFKTINKFNIIHPSFMTIDYLRMMADPLISYWRIEKAFKRFYLLNKYYPLPHVTNEIKFSENTDPINARLLENVLAYLKNKTSVIVVGLYALNFYINKSGINEKKYIKLLKVPYYEFISINFKDDVLELINLLKIAIPEAADQIVVEEHYPFFQFIGHSAYIYHNNNLIARIIHHYNKCLPKQDVPYSTYDTNKFILLDDKSFIQIGTFTVALLFSLMFVFKYRTDENNDLSNLYYAICSQLTESRKYYLEKNKLTVFDNSYFKDFILTCIGTTLPLERERRQLLDYRKKKNKRLTFIYEPAGNKPMNKEDINYIFANSSGNAIHNKHNLTLTENSTDNDNGSEEPDTI